jgi:signal transduction histidine kinase/CheY-like chemotaxis protein
MVALPALALLVYMNVDRRQRDAESVAQNALRLARLAAANQERLVEGARQLLIAMSQSPNIRDADPEKCYANLEQLLEQYGKSYTNLGVADSTGAVLCSGIPGPQISVADRTYFILALKNRTFAVGDYMIGRRSGEPSLGFGYPLIDPGGEVRGAVYAAMNLNELNTSLTGGEWPAGVTLTVTDRRGAIVARHPDSDRWLGQTLAEPPSVASTTEGTTEQEEEGEARIVAFAAVTTPANTGLAVRVDVSRSQALLPVNRVMYQGLLALGLLALLVMAGAKATSDRLILRPIEQLVKASQRLEQGDLGARVASSTTIPELSELGKAFDRMAATLEEREAARLRAEIERKDLEQQYRQSQKMEAIGQLAGGVAHDFNNLLTAILGYSELLAEALGPDSPHQADLGEIRRAANQAAALTRQLLAFGRRQILEPRVLDLGDSLTAMEPMLRRLIGEHIAVETRTTGHVGRVKADPGQIEQVILNLAINARDAMPEGGTLMLELADVTLDKPYTLQHAGTRPGRYVMLTVSDTGVGMDEATRARIFEPFFTTKELGKGTGLGLSTVYGIVTQSGGNIWVYSEPGGGSTFKVYLPRVDAPPDQPPVRVAPDSLAGDETILVVEDEPGVRALVQKVLAQYGYQVVVAATPQEALLIATREAGRFDLVISDVVLPQMSGRALAAQILSSQPHARVLYMSGYTDNAIVHRGVLDAGTPFLQKPFTPEALARKTREVLQEGWS